MAEIKQRLVLMDRAYLELKGVVKVENFANSHIQLATTLGDLHLKGEELEICHLNLEEQEIAVKGMVVSLEYKNIKSGKNLVSRLLK